MGSVARLSLNFTVSTSAGLLMKIVVIGLLGEEHSACATRAALSGHPPVPFDPLDFQADDVTCLRLSSS